MEVIDFNCGPDKLLFNIVEYGNNIDKNNDEMMWDCYNALNIYRHNTFHYFVLRSLDLEWIEERKIQDYFDILLPSNIGNKSPDIFLQIDKNIWFIDVSISTSTAEIEREKYTKYNPIVLYLNDLGYNTKFYHLNLESHYGNLDLELEKIRFLMKKDFEYTFFYRIMTTIEDQKKIISKNIDKDYFEKKKKENYGLRDDDDKSTAGRYKDIDIDLKTFKEYNKLFISEENIVENHNKFDYNVFCDYMKNIIENPDSMIYQLYSDKKMNHHQFDEVRNDLYEQNKNKTKRKYPKPVFHVMTHIDDEQINYDLKEKVENIEQDNINNFIDEFLTSVKSEENCFMFLKDLLSQHVWALKISEDKEINNDIYYKTNRYKELFAKYKKIADKVNLYNNYSKSKNKLKQNIAIRYNYKGDPRSQDELKRYMEKIRVKYNLDNKKSFSFRDYLRENQIINTDDNTTYYKRNKFLKCDMSNFKSVSTKFYKKSGIKFDIQERLSKLDDSDHTLDLKDYVIFDNFLSIISKKNKNETTFHNEEFHYKKIYKLDDYILTDDYGVDHDAAKTLKRDHTRQYKQFYLKLRNTHCFDFFYRLKNLYDQLYSITNQEAKSNMFYMFNGGQKNMLIVVAMESKKVTMKNGVPFICVLKTKNPEYYNNGVFGRTYTYKISENNYYVCTNWRRINIEKLTVLRDSFFSALSTTMNSVLSSPSPLFYLHANKLVYNLCIRCSFSNVISQRVGELLMDTRYAYMSALSIYTNIGKLLREKIGTVYKSIIETWIINRLLNRLKEIHVHVLNHSIVQNKIEFDHNVRDINTIGGRIKLPSLWGNYYIFDMTELMDEAFIYVHTMKEPSNIYHEQVEAIKTIYKFQSDYEKLNFKRKHGLIMTKEEMDDFLLSDIKIGCHSSVIIDSVKYTIQKDKPNFKKYIHELNSESVGELLSTKAVIPKNDREIVEKPLSKRDLEKRIISFKKVFKMDPDPEDIEDMKNYIISSNSNVYNKYKLRQKVMETIYQYINDYDITRTVHLANHFIKNEGGKVVSDICIKSQYGSKREFYVVNMGAKALARVTENFFKNISDDCDNEMISVPGDKKIIVMQQLLDKIYLNQNLTSKHKIMYVNGDCTKWSAAETMQSFISMCVPFKEIITDKLYNLLLATFNAWSDKEIQIPMDIFNKVIPCQEKGTYFLKSLKENKKATIHSTQNFLQGMFNYSSSYKAVCCTNYAYRVWTTIYPNTTLILEHLEHSDDYVLVVMYTDISDFEKFRVLQKIMMRFHGFNDSDRKTSCQPFMMEFVSQMSFNGVMLYPQIKKAKEVNLSLPCTGYKQDMESALSRVGECMRVGCNMSFLYFFQRLHCYVVASAYSILPGMKNNRFSYQELLNMPIELFGVPDCLPLFSVYCRGNVNNVRLFEYGNSDTKNIIRGLYYIGREELEKEDFMNEDKDYNYSLQSPRFMYDVLNNRQSKFKLKFIKMTMNEVSEFWKNNITYKFLKPVDIDNLKKWIMCMFYNRTFLEAYLSTSRSMMTMRLNHYVSSRIIRNHLKLQDYTLPLNQIHAKSLTISEYIDNMIKLFDTKEYDDFSDNIIRKIISKCDPTYSAIYNLLEMISLDHVTEKDNSTTVQVACYTPYKLKTIVLRNQPGVILQYLFDNHNFIKDKRTLHSDYSMNKDLLTLNERYSKKILTDRNPMNVLMLYNDMMINKEKRIVMFTHNRHVYTLSDSLCTVLSNTLVPGCTVKTNITNVLTVRDPIDQSLLYHKSGRLVRDMLRGCTDNIFLIFTYLYNKCMIPLQNTREMIDRIRFHYGTESFSYKQIVKNVDDHFYKQYKYTNEDMKMMAYLHVALYDDYTYMDKLINSVYTFSYKYTIRDYPVGGKYLGTTLVKYTYYNITVMAYYNHKIYEHPIIIMNKHHKTMTNILYNIAIKLTLGMSDHVFEDTYNEPRINQISYDIVKKIKRELKQKYNLTHVIKQYSKVDNFIKLNNIKKEDKYLPMFITGNVLLRQGVKHMGDKIISAKCDLDNLGVYIGKFKLFTLKYWQCRQTNNMSISGERRIVIDNIYLDELLHSNRLENYFSDKVIDFTDMSVHNKSENYKINLLKRHIREKKLYNIEIPDEYHEDMKYILNYNDVDYDHKYRYYDDIMTVDEEKYTNEDKNIISSDQVTNMPFAIYNPINTLTEDVLMGMTQPRILERKEINIDSKQENNLDINTLCNLDMDITSEMIIDNDMLCDFIVDNPDTIDIDSAPKDDMNKGFLDFGFDSVVTMDNFVIDDQEILENNIIENLPIDTIPDYEIINDCLIDNNIDDCGYFDDYFEEENPKKKTNVNKDDFTCMEEMDISNNLVNFLTSKVIEVDIENEDDDDILFRSDFFSRDKKRNTKEFDPIQGLNMDDLFITRPSLRKHIEGMNFMIRALKNKPTIYYKYLMHNEGIKTRPCTDSFNYLKNINIANKICQTNNGLTYPLLLFLNQLLTRTKIVKSKLKLDICNYCTDNYLRTGIIMEIKDYDIVRKLYDNGKIIKYINNDMYLLSCKLETYYTKLENYVTNNILSWYLIEVSDAVDIHITREIYDCFNKNKNNNNNTLDDYLNL